MKLNVNNLCCIRQHEMLFENISFQLEPGDALIIEGPNGSGKSSLLRLVAGLATPTAGHVRWQDRLIHPANEDYTANMHYIGHQNGIKHGLTVKENIRLSGHLNDIDDLGLPENARTTLALEQLGLDEHANTPVSFLSAGQKRRVALIKLFLVPKTIWILDEPFTALDIDSQTRLKIKLEEHLAHGGICLMSTHQIIQLKHCRQQTLRLNEC